MPTLKQKKVAKTIVESIKSGKTPTDIEILKSSNYATSTAETKSTKIINSKGVQEALEELGFTELNAQKVVTEIMLNSDVAPNDRLKATDQVFKVHGSYAKEQETNVTNNLIYMPIEILEKHGITPSSEGNSEGQA